VDSPAKSIFTSRFCGSTQSECGRIVDSQMKSKSSASFWSIKTTETSVSARKIVDEALDGKKNCGRVPRVTLVTFDINALNNSSVPRTELWTPRNCGQPDEK